MVLLVEDVGKFLGRDVQTPYNLRVGRLIGVDTNIRNEVTQVSIEQTSGVLAKYPITQVKIQDKSLVLSPEWKDEACDLQREYLTASKRMFALKALVSDGDIDSESYREMKSEYENAIHAMETRRLALVDSLKERSGKLEDLIRRLQLSLTDNKLLYSSGAVEVAAYKDACQIIHEMLQAYAAERKDLQGAIEGLSALERTQLTEEPRSEKAEHKIPDFVVVKIHEETPA